MTVLPTGTPYYGGGQTVNPANVILTRGAPPTVLTEDKVGTIAVDNAAQTAYMLVSKTGGVDKWSPAAGSASLNTLSGNTGTASPTLGNIQLAGATNQIDTSAAGSTVTFELPTTLIAPGSVTVTGAFTVQGPANTNINSSLTSIMSDTVNIAPGGGPTSVLIGVGDVSSPSTITIGPNSVNGTTSDIDIGTGANIGGVVTIRMGTGTGSKNIAIGTVDVASVSMGSTTSTSATSISSGTGGINLTSTQDFDVLASSHATITSNGATQNSIRLNTTAGGVQIDTVTGTQHTGNFTLFQDGDHLISTNFATTTAGGNSAYGTVALVGGTATVTTSAISANAVVIATVQDLGTVAVPHPIAITARTPGVSFVITSDDNTDTSTVAWFIVGLGV